MFTLTENLNHYNEFFQKKNIFYSQIYNKIKESYVLFAEMVLALDKENPQFEDFYFVDLTPQNQESPKETLNISQFQERFFKNYYKPDEEKLQVVKAEEFKMCSKIFIIISAN